MWRAGSKAGAPQTGLHRHGDCEALAGEVTEISYYNAVDMVQSQPGLALGTKRPRSCRDRAPCHTVPSFSVTEKKTGCSASQSFANAGKDTQLQSVYNCSKKKVSSNVAVFLKTFSMK